jgi:hypothetical protein
MTEAVPAPGWPREYPSPGDRLHQPWRLLVVLVEVVLAALAVWGAFACWQNSATVIELRLADGTDLSSTHYAGEMVAGAIGLATLAAVLLIDAARQLLLGVRARRGSRRSRQGKGRHEA